MLLKESICISVMCWLYFGTFIPLLEGIFASVRAFLLFSPRRHIMTWSLALLMHLLVIIQNIWTLVFLCGCVTWYLLQHFILSLSITIKVKTLIPSKEVSLSFRKHWLPFGFWTSYVKWHPTLSFLVTYKFSWSDGTSDWWVKQQT